MENNEYNSLTEKLIKSGILQPENPIKEESINFFNAKNSDSEIEPEPLQEESVKKETTSRKRINNYDLELLEKTEGGSNPFDSKNKFEELFFKFFPKLYEIKIAKNAIQKLNELGIDTNSLLEKSVPYGENELRYKNLVKFINYANEIQAKLNKNPKLKKAK